MELLIVVRVIIIVVDHRAQLDTLRSVSLGAVNFAPRVVRVGVSVILIVSISGNVANEEIEDLIIIADDMGSLEIDDNDQVMAYGTETGAFVRLDDLQKGYALGQIDRTIIMNPEGLAAGGHALATHLFVF